VGDRAQGNGGKGRTDGQGNEILLFHDLLR
jgi:hypothetical protein